MKKTALILACLFLISLFPISHAEGFQGTAQGFSSEVSVRIVVENAIITTCEIDASGETAAIGGAAADQLAQMIVAGNGAVDAIAGATMTSNAVSAALQSAMTQAGLLSGETGVMKAGTYTGSAHGFSCIDKVYVDVTVSDTAIEALALQDTFREGADSYENPYMCKGAFVLLEPKMLAQQSIAVDAVTGATGSSTGIKNAVRDALMQAYTAAGHTETEATAAINQRFMASETHTSAQETLSYDVVVVGAGASGAIASLSALEEGVSVLNIEKAFRWGGQSMLTGGPKVFSPDTTEAQVEEEVAKYEQIIASCRLGTDAVWNDPAYVAEHAEEFTDFNHDAYRAVVPASGKGAALMMKNGIQFSILDLSAMAASSEGAPEGMSGGMEAGPPPMAMEMPAIDLQQVMDATSGLTLGYIKAEEYYATLYENYLAQGGDALLSTAVTALRYDENGKIIGVIAEDDDGTSYTVDAKRVILATGGFGANEEMCDQYTPGGSAWIYYGWQGNQGDGIRMALEAGAAPYNMDAYPMSHQRMGAQFITAFEVQYTEEGKVWSPNDLTVVLAVNPEGVYMTADGTPFMSENNGSIMGGFSSAMGSYNLGSTYYIVYSEAQLEAYRTQGIANTTMGFQNVGEGIPALYPLGEWVDTVLGEASRQGWAWHVSTLEEGDTQLGFAQGTLAAAYAADPAQASMAQDENGFWIIQGTGLSISSCGGVEVNASMQAVREDGSVIKNLYVVGNDGFGNIMATGAEYSIGGDAGMWCFGSGYIAGKEAAAL